MILGIDGDTLTAITDLVIVLGLLISWLGYRHTVREAIKQKQERDIKERSELKSQIQEIKKKLEDKEDGLAAVNRRVSDIKTNCASTAAGILARLSSLNHR